MVPTKHGSENTVKMALRWQLQGRDTDGFQVIATSSESPRSRRYAMLFLQEQILHGGWVQEFMCTISFQVSWQTLQMYVWTKRDWSCLCQIIYINISKFYDILRSTCEHMWCPYVVKNFTMPSPSFWFFRAVRTRNGGQRDGQFLVWAFKTKTYEDSGVFWCCSVASIGKWNFSYNLQEYDKQIWDKMGRSIHCSHWRKGFALELEQHYHIVCRVSPTV